MLEPKLKDITLKKPVPYEIDTTIESDSKQIDDVMMEQDRIWFLKYKSRN